MKKEGITLKSRWRDEYNKFPSKEFFEEFKKKHKEYANIPNDRLRNIIVKFNERFTDYIYLNKDGIELPYGIGNVFMYSYKRKSPNHYFDYKLSKQLGKVIKYLDYDTDGRMLKIAYMTCYTKMPFNTRSIWNLDTTDAIKSKCSHEFRKNYGNYYYVTGKGDVKVLFKRK